MTTRETITILVRSHGWWEFGLNRYSASLISAMSIKLRQQKNPTASGRTMRVGIRGSIRPSPVPSAPTKARRLPSRRMQSAISPNSATKPIGGSWSVWDQGGLSFRRTIIPPTKTAPISAQFGCPIEPIPSIHGLLMDGRRMECCQPTLWTA